MDSRLDTGQPRARRWDWIARPTGQLVVLMVIGAALRLTGLSWFPEINADEGLYTVSSKNLLSFGDWFMDGRVHLFVSPTFHAFSVILFKVFGPSIFVARIVSAIAGVASIGLIYVLVLKLTERKGLAFVASATFTCGFAQILYSRWAIVESLELMFVLAAVVAMTTGTWRGVALAGTAAALALLTKANAVIFLPIVPFVLARGPFGALLRDREWLLKTAAFGVIGVGLAITIYGSLYLAYPSQFLSAFQTEISAVLVTEFPRTFFHHGRFGLSPELIGRTILGLFRQSPFLMVLFTLGVALSLVQRRRPPLGISTWLLFGSAYFLLQIYQPLRYFFLLSPALCYFAAVAVMAFQVEDARAIPRLAAPAPVAALLAYVVFNVGYTGMNAVANPARMVRDVGSWVERNTTVDDRIIAAGYLCTDLPNRAYAHYYLGDTIDELSRSISELGVKYVIFDAGEWPAHFREGLSDRFELLHEWPFGAVFRVDRRRPRSGL